MADNNRKVEIDAAWFAELYARWKEWNVIEDKLEDTIVERDELKAKLEQKAKFLDECERQFQEKVEELGKEISRCNELKAKLEDAKAHYCTNATVELGNACKVAALCRENEVKLAAAERCIEEIASVTSVGVIANCAEGWRINNTIRDYREKKEAK